MNHKLKPCPFCGQFDPVSIVEYMGYFSVNCSDCDVDGPLADHREGAVDSWNIRANREPNLRG